MGAGLASAHQAGIVHRDFKSGNVMLGPVAGGATRAVVMDFGLARSAAADITLPAEHGVSPSATVGEGSSGLISRSSTPLGTPEYPAPEQVEGSEVTAAADIYALGIVMYQMVTGTWPFVGETRLLTATKRLNQAPAPPRTYLQRLEDRRQESVFSEGVHFFDSGDFPSARRRFEDVIQLNGKKRADAEKYLAQADAATRDDRVFNGGVSAFEAGRFEDARKAFDQLINGGGKRGAEARDYLKRIDTPVCGKPRFVRQ